ncbi:hypothetical protein HCBG_02212 [Histoplasma capsulatum G186AR]|uniref:Uncharacterized protein n=1 Tax=Ajellomyces capsulatus (strain G186AR / H82 / ATCC MYA-2454 / RMSCC 2432) TaxID=447093 RepID=C0NIF5_AJECG|nr:uncharacterized protein HCBG_02212 [Histoplasma capsulatum G186AR]EEH08675.1 hypothetical protein HCBG_02212 [Histoplasma capsulatum G186AR]
MNELSGRQTGNLVVFQRSVEGSVAAAAGCANTQDNTQTFSMAAYPGYAE